MMITCTFVNKTREKQWKENYPDFQRIAEHALEVLNKQGDYTISVIFVKSRKIHEINRDYRQVDRPTDVMSFAACDDQDEFELIEEAEVELGDIFINVEAAISQAEEYGHSLRREICFLFTHGLLHCFGYDHMQPDEEKIMFDLQHEILDPLVPRV